MPGGTGVATASGAVVHDRGEADHCESVHAVRLARVTDDEIVVISLVEIDLGDRSEPEALVQRRGDLYEEVVEREHT